ncbi:hypothetical protein M407DRAFT_35013 [Tulasnella calospora MUT 4182]|uniref:Uncharacterized protein n=1 Tax=Tulasnella calospora MUT 4182 TaxID=1051891 RepID=A0A0C3Q0F7_9AGAM|nr:hypothetical protein M407DRAFT_35013 [Tulasnella calospora MUT 4182]
MAEGTMPAVRPRYAGNNDGNQSAAKGRSESSNISDTTSQTGSSLRRPSS